MTGICPWYAGSTELDHSDALLVFLLRQLIRLMIRGVAMSMHRHSAPQTDNVMNTDQSTLGPSQAGRLRIAVVGTGISGMSAAWLLAQRHDVTVYEKDDRIGGHTNTVQIDDHERPVAVDTGFIVYNQRSYPNLVALFEHLGVQTRATDMSFAASLDGGRFEYSGADAAGLIAQRRNILRPRLWLMVRDVLRFYREARQDLGDGGAEEITLGEYLRTNGYSKAFVRDHLLPMGAAIWSTPAEQMLEYPLAAFVRFCDNHGLLQVADRPVWRTVVGGSGEYVRKLTAGYRDNVLLNTGVTAIHREAGHVQIEDRQGGSRRFDQVVIAAHADQALAMLSDPDPAEQRLLSRFEYQRNLAVLHTDTSLMPRTRRAWASWNFLSEGRADEQKVAVSYWMNRLQGLETRKPLIVTLNPPKQPDPGKVLRSFMYEHPTFNLDAVRAQRLLWNLQGVRRTWFCGAHFGSGFHEDGLQSGLAVAEQLGGLNRPWTLDEPSNRITCHDIGSMPGMSEAA